MLSSDSQVILHLSLIEGVGPQKALKLLQCFSVADVYSAQAHDIQQRTGLSPQLCIKIEQGLADKKMLNQELLLLEKHRISLVTVADADYPDVLRHIHQPPLVLYYQGGPLTLLSKTLAFVGSRKADLYAQQVVDSVIPGVVAQGFTTVSGGALGVDGMVHRATLQAQGKTVAILGSGLLQLYPRGHISLFKQMVEQGSLVMSPFPLTMEPLPTNFPARNRIIAGLCPATIVIQAAEKSGALLTARYALDEGREVGVIPGSIFNPLSAGCHELLVHGARSITKTDDIFELLGYQAPTSTPFTVPLKPRVSGQKEQDPVLVWCQKPASSDDLLIKTGFSPDELQDKLWNLQIAGKIEQNLLGQWQAL